MPLIAEKSLHFEELSLGLCFVIAAIFSEEEMGRFALISGDHSPIHTDDGVARQCGFPRRLVYGFQALSLLSAIVGDNFHNAVCAAVSIDFVAPAFVGDRVIVRAEVAQIQAAIRGVSLAVKIYREDTELIARGKLLTRFL